MRIAKLWKQGHSIVLTIPQEMLHHSLHLEAGDYVWMESTSAGILISRPPRSKDEVQNRPRKSPLHTPN